MFVEDLIARSKNPSIVFRLVVNNKFYVSIQPCKFHANKYRSIISKYMFLYILDKQEEPRYDTYDIKKFYVQSDELERDLLFFENQWYDNKNLYLKEK